MCNEPAGFVTEVCNKVCNVCPPRLCYRPLQKIHCQIVFPLRCPLKSPKATRSSLNKSAFFDQTYQGVLTSPPPHRKKEKKGAAAALRSHSGRSCQLVPGSEGFGLGEGGAGGTDGGGPGPAGSGGSLGAAVGFRT